VVDVSNGFMWQGILDNYVSKTLDDEIESKRAESRASRKSRKTGSVLSGNTEQQQKGTFPMPMLKLPQLGASNFLGKNLFKAVNSNYQE
jgi:hypothetical protein